MSKVKCDTHDTQRYPVCFLKRASRKGTNVQVSTIPTIDKKSPICVASNMGTWALVASVCTYLTKRLSLHWQLPRKSSCCVPIFGWPGSSGICNVAPSTIQMARVPKIRGFSALISTVPAEGVNGSNDISSPTALMVLIA